MRRKVLVVILVVCLIVGMVPIPTIAQPSPPTEFKGQINDEDISISKIEGGYEIGLYCHLWTSFYVFFDEVYQGTIEYSSIGGTWGYFYTPCKVSHISIAAAEGSSDEGRAWYRNLQEDDYPETEDINAYYLRINKEGIEDKNPYKPRIQGVVEIPFEYNLRTGLHHPANYQIKVDGKEIIDTFVDNCQNAKVEVTGHNTPLQGCSAKQLKGKGSESIKLATHLFGNGSHVIELQYWPNIKKGYSDIVSLNFQNEVEVTNWEKKFSEWGMRDIIFGGEWDELGHADITEAELTEYFGGPYEHVTEVNEKLSQWGFYDITFLPDEDAGEFEFVGDVEKKKDDWLPKVSAGLTIVGIVLLPPIGWIKAAVTLVTMAGQELIFMGGDEIYKITQPERGLKYREIPSGDLEGNIYLLFIRTSAKLKYVNGVLKFQMLYPFYLSQSGDWEFPTKNVVEGSKLANTPAIVRLLEEDTEWEPTAECVEWLEKPTTIKDGVPTRFTLKIKDKVLPNLHDEAMHLDIEIPKGVEISNVRVKGAGDTEAKAVEFYRVHEEPYDISKIFSTSCERGEGRIAINIPKVYQSTEEIVSFNLTVDEKEQQQVPIRIFYGLIPAKVYTIQTGASMGIWNSIGVYKDANPLTVEQPKKISGAYEWVNFYEPYGLKQSFYITPYTQLDFEIVAEPNRNSYHLEETAQVTIYVTNNRDQDTEIWLGTTFKDTEGKEHHIPLKHAVIPKGETESFNIEWTIPADAPLGQYEIAVNCYKDAGQNEDYTDNIEWAPIFNVDMITPTPPEFDFDAILALISDFFEALIVSLNELVTGLKEKTISVPPEQKAIENVEEELSALAGMADAYSEFMKMICELSEVDPSECPGVNFNYHVLSSTFCNSMGEAQTYMSSEGIESTEINDALELVKELELEKEGFCIVVVDYSFTGYGEYESGKYPVVCNEKGDPFWQSWQFYEKIKGEIEEDYKEYK